MYVCIGMLKIQLNPSPIKLNLNFSWPSREYVTFPSLLQEKTLCTSAWPMLWDYKLSCDKTSAKWTWLCKLAML